MLVKQKVAINFSQGLDTKTDPWQVSIGNFLELQNSIFGTGGQLKKRNGFGPLPPLSLPPDRLTTFNGDLTAIGSTIQALSSSTETWFNKGNFTPIDLSVIPAARSTYNITQSDSVTSLNGLTCVVYTQVNNGAPTYRYLIEDSVTGQIFVNPTVIPVTIGAVTGSSRVFLLGGYFVIVFTNVITGTPHLQYVAISVSNPTVVTANADIAASYTPAASVSFDGVVVGNKLFIAYDTVTGGQQIKFTYLDTSLIVANPQSFAGSIATMMSVTADISNPSNPIIYASFYDSASQVAAAVAVDQNLNQRMTATTIFSGGVMENVTSAAQNGLLNVIFEVNNVYAYDSLPTNYLNKVTVTLPNTVTTGSVGAITVLLRSVGLASKAFIINSTIYVLGEYRSTLQSTYFLFDYNGNIISRFAYENGGGAVLLGLPQAEVLGNKVFISYLYKDLIQSVAVSFGSQGAPNASNIYAQTGVNVATIAFSPDTLSVSEIGANLNISGGMLWAYDGQTIDEQGFSLFPDDIRTVWSSTGGNISAQPDGSTNINAYYYIVVYQWTDSQGNIIQSAPSIPYFVTTTGSGTTGSITVSGPTLRLTYKTGVKIVIYRWSVENETYFQVTSITAPLLNDPTVDQFTFVDTQSDSSIVGNSILYTTGGVLEDIAGPASTATTLFDDRLWLIDAEDRNLLWFSKQIIEGTPVEMSDLLTVYVAPTTGSQGSTGPMQCLFPMDDKLIIFKDNAIYYINGTGPDNTGANSQYSQPIFITSTVGSSNQNSIVFMPGGLMFQSDKGIWLLGRDLTTSYIGAPVEEFNGFIVTSAENIPETNEVRFTLNTGVILMYDYFYSTWGTFTGVDAISSTLYQNLQTCATSTGAVLQETPNIYLDNGNPTLLSFKTSWINVAGLQGYQRAYWFFLLGQYLTPHKLSIAIAYDYNPSPTQGTLISPDNFAQNYGVPSPYGQEAEFGGPGNVEKWRVFLDKMRCQSFQITLNEIYDPSYGVPAGAGLTLSGIDLIIAVKRGWRSQSAAHSVGSNA